MKYTVIIPAAGSSLRAGNYDKLLFKINNQPVIKHTVNLFYEDADCNQIILVVKQNQYDFYKKMFCLYSKLIVVKGGLTRFESVQNGFKYVRQDYVLIHDGARPYLTENLLNNIKNHLKDYEVVIPTISLIDAIIEVNPNYQYVNRNNYKLVQTPQGFRTQILKQAYQKNTSSNFHQFNDEGSFVLKTIPNVSIIFIDGEQKNKKITYESDFAELFCLD